MKCVPSAAKVTPRSRAAISFATLNTSTPPGATARLSTSSQGCHIAGGKCVNMDSTKTSSYLSGNLIDAESCADNRVFTPNCVCRNSILPGSTSAQVTRPGNTRSKWRVNRPNPAANSSTLPIFNNGLSIDSRRSGAAYLGGGPRSGDLAERFDDRDTAVQWTIKTVIAKAHVVGAKVEFVGRPPASICPLPDFWSRLELISSPSSRQLLRGQTACGPCPERIAFDPDHRIKGDTRHDQRLACPGSPSL